MAAFRAFAGWMVILHSTISANTSAYLPLAFNARKWRCGRRNQEKKISYVLEEIGRQTGSTIPAPLTRWGGWPPLVPLERSRVSDPFCGLCTRVPGAASLLIFKGTVIDLSGSSFAGPFTLFPFPSRTFPFSDPFGSPTSDNHHQIPFQAPIRQQLHDRPVHRSQPAPFVHGQSQ